MSDLARNYVKSLSRSRVRRAQRSFLFFLADYHNFDTGIAMPGLERLAEDMGLTVRQIRNLVKECQDLNIISWTPGRGSGNLGTFVFLRLPKRHLGRMEERKEEIKAEGKGEILGDVIRKNLEPRTQNNNQDHHGFAGLRVWLLIKEEMKAELGPEEYNLWVEPCYLLRELDHKHLLLSLPPNSKIITAYKKREKWLRAKLHEYGYSCTATRYPDVFELERIREDYPHLWDAQWQTVYARFQRKKNPAAVVA
jgi:hypothetical protein